MAVIFVPVVFVLSYFLKHDPDFLERRLQMKEKEQKLIQKVGAIIFFNRLSASWLGQAVWMVERTL